MLFAHISNWKNIIHLIVDKSDIYDTKDHEYGFEEEPHITLLYGIHDDEVDKKKLYKELKAFNPVRVTIDKISIFENEDYDVVKLEVNMTKELKHHRKKLEEGFPNTQTFKGYKPHMSVAYVKKGEGKKYVQKLSEQIELTLDEVVYSDHDYKKKRFKIS